MSRATRWPVTGHDAQQVRLATRQLGRRIGLCAAVIVVVLSGLAMIVVVQGQHGAATTLLDQAVARADDVTDPPAGVWLVAQGPAGRVATPGLPPGLPDQAALARTVATGVTTTGEYQTSRAEYQVLTARRGTTSVQAALDLSANHAERDRLALALLLCGTLGLVLAAVAGVWLARRAVRPMATALAVQRQFVADAGHELRTPLTQLSTRVQLLKRHLSGAGTPENLLGEADKVVTDAHHLAAILEDLLLAADPTTDTAVMFDLAELAQEVTQAHHTAADSADITLTIRLPGTPVPVRGAPTAVRRAVTALLDNAIRHAGSAVTLTITTDAHHALLDVVDDGPGVDPEMLPRMFDRFATTRSHAPSQAPSQAPLPSRRRYGLGLALVSDIAARHGGDVTASAERSGGSRLRLSLPLAG